MTIKDAIDKLDDLAIRQVLEFVLVEFSKPSFGALSKKEIEMLMLEALVRIGYIDSEPSLYQLIQLLRVTRSKSRSLLYERDLRRLDVLSLDALLQSAIAAPLIQKQGELFCLEIENPLLIDHLKHKLRVIGYPTDGSFSPSIVRLSLDAFNALIVSSIPERSHGCVRDALIQAGAPDGSLAGIVRGVLVKLGSKFAGSAGEDLGEKISDYLIPLMAGTATELVERVSGFFPFSV